MMIKAEGEGQILGLQVAGGAPKLTHLFFADDALLFSKATMEELYQIVGILNLYSNTSSQRINLNKSGLICVKFITHDLKQKLARVMRMQVWESPGRYLSLPAEWGRSRASSLEWIKDGIFAKLEGWKDNLLNQAGKEVLIKAVIQAIPAYAMAIIRFPNIFCKKISSAVARFW